LALLLIVWFVVALVYRFIQRDTIEHDRKHLWENYPITLQDIAWKKSKRH
jgi:hypothetical protein